MLPPPNITGTLHLGHALTVALQDAIIRQKRMTGHNVRWIPGFDHAGLATQRIVEKLIKHEKNMTRQELGRQKFIDRIQEWKDSRRIKMREQLLRLGLNLDWDEEFFTMDEKSSFAVKTAFKRLFAKGLVYRAEKPVFYSEILGTTLSDIEVEMIDGTNRYTRTGEIVTRKPIAQWFVNMQDLAKTAVAVVESEKIKIKPPNYINSWSSWLLANGAEDWCISRQSWWGHSIPAFKRENSEDKQENWIVADDITEASVKLDVPEQCVVQDEDVLDTWFSSSLLPLTLSGWPQENFELSLQLGKFPLQMLETGFDILTYWVSKMVLMSIALENMIPFETVLLHGMICDSRGKKMSKSKGNVVDPLDIMDGVNLSDLLQRTQESHSQGLLDDNEFLVATENQKRLFPKGLPACGADGLRAYLLSNDIQEEIIRVQTSQVEAIRRLSNKIWNIFRYAMKLFDSLEKPVKRIDVDELDASNLDDADCKVLKELAKCVLVTNKSFTEKYDLHVALHCLEKFWINDLSSMFLSDFKKTNKEEIIRKCPILLLCLDTSLKLFHPFMPHLTELLYQKLEVMLNSKKPEDLQPLCDSLFPQTNSWQRFSSIDKMNY